MMMMKLKLFDPCSKLDSNLPPNQTTEFSTLMFQIVQSLVYISGGDIKTIHVFGKEAGKALDLKEIVNADILVQLFTSTIVPSNVSVHYSMHNSAILRKVPNMVPNLCHDGRHDKSELRNPKKLVSLPDPVSRSILVTKLFKDLCLVATFISRSRSNLYLDFINETWTRMKIDILGFGGVLADEKRSHFELMRVLMGTSAKCDTAALKFTKFKINPINPKLGSLLPNIKVFVKSDITRSVQATLAENVALDHEQRTRQQ